MNKDLNTLYGNRNTGFDLSDFRPVSSDRKSQIIQKMRENSKKQTKEFISTLKSVFCDFMGVFIIVVIMTVFLAIAMNSKSLEHEDITNDCHIDPLTGSRLEICMN